MNTKLEEVINQMAKARFNADSKNYHEFMIKNATIGEFINYMVKKGWDKNYGDTKLGKMGGLAESLNREVLWPKMKDQYIESVTNDLMNKMTNVEVTISVTNS